MAKKYVIYSHALDSYIVLEENKQFHSDEELGTLIVLDSKSNSGDIVSGYSDSAYKRTTISVVHNNFIISGFRSGSMQTFKDISRFFSFSTLLKFAKHGTIIKASSINL